MTALAVASRVCSRCGKDKPLGEYYRQQLAKRAPYCKVCRKAAMSASRKRNHDRQKERRAETRERLTALKLTLVCVDCGWAPEAASECWWLHFDHIDPATKDESAKAAGAFRREWPWERIEAEIALCQPRCMSCHGFRTARQRRGLDPYPVPWSRTNPLPPQPTHPVCVPGVVQ